MSLERGHLPPALAGLPGSIPEALAARRAAPDAPWVIGHGFRLSFGEADTRSAALAGRLMAAGVGKGTRLGVLFPNTPDWVVAWLAAARIGALTVPLSTFSPGLSVGRGSALGELITFDLPGCQKQALRVPLGAFSGLDQGVIFHRRLEQRV